jgi:hypothetical protein
MTPRDSTTPRESRDRSPKDRPIRERVQLRTRTSSEGRAEPELVVDDVPVRHERLPGGTYYLPENAYVWSDDLRRLGEQLVIDRDRGALPTVDPSREES